MVLVLGLIRDVNHGYFIFYHSSLRKCQLAERICKFRIKKCVHWGGYIKSERLISIDFLFIQQFQTFLTFGNLRPLVTPVVLLSRQSRCIRCIVAVDTGIGTDLLSRQWEETKISASTTLPESVDYVCRAWYFQIKTSVSYCLPFEINI